MVGPDAVAQDLRGNVDTNTDTDTLGECHIMMEAEFGGMHL